VAADPSIANVNSNSTGPLALALFAALALWALALATYIVTRALPDAVLIAREPTWRIILRAAIPGAAAAALAAGVITAIAVPVLGLGFGETLEFLGVTLLAALAFVSLNQAATAIFGRSGRLASLAILIVAAATGTLSTLPSTFYSVAEYLPTHGAVLALRAVATDSPGLANGIVELVAWLAMDPCQHRRHRPAPLPLPSPPASSCLGSLTQRAPRLASREQSSYSAGGPEHCGRARGDRWSRVRREPLEFVGSGGHCSAVGACQ
jgi:hypothetical protein